MAADDGFLWVAGRTDAEIQGAVHAIPPGWSIGESRTHKDGLPGFPELFDPETLIWKKEKFLPWLLSAFDRAFHPLGTSLRDSYFLSIIGVSPSAQGTGVGVALMRAVQDEATKEGVPITLMCGEAPTVRWYIKCGFEEALVDHLEVRGKVETMTLLIWRPPI